MRGLKVFLFISFLVLAIFGVLGLFFPSLLTEMMGADSAHVRVLSTGLAGLAIGMWYAFRNPLKSLGLIIAAIAWLSLEALVLLISGIAGSIPWGSVLPGVIIDVVLTAGLAYFYPRGEKAS